MFQPDMWPFTPVCLSEIIDPDNLSVIESGCCERLGRPLTILDCNPNAEASCRRIESLNEKRRYEEFCHFLRSDENVNGGDETCKQEDSKQAEISLQEFARTGDPFRLFTCYMGLQDMTYVVRIRHRPVAVVFSGQYCSPGCTARIRERVQRLGREAYSHVQLGNTAREQLLALADKLPTMPQDIQAGLEREARHIQKIAEAEFERGKRQWEQDFLAGLQRVLIGSEVSRERKQLQAKLREALGLIRAFCQCEYVVFFASVREHDTGLASMVEVGVPPEVVSSLPHFNWKKAGLPLEHFDGEAWDLAGWQREGGKGLRGENSRYFASACLVPTSLGNRYRGTLALGPFAEEIDVRQEQHFLNEMASTIGLFALTELEVLDLERERRRWESTAKLLTHQVRTALTPITAQIGRSKSLVQKSSGGVDIKRVSEFLSRAEDLALLLAHGASKTVEGHVLQVERDDLEFERYPLSVIVENCASAFARQVQQKQLELIVDSSVELLPEADVDVARLTIALANLIDNAVKYSYSDSKIIIRSQVVLAEGIRPEMAMIEVDDIGLGIREEEQQRIFEQGTRGLTAAKLGHIPGSGLGLWEARAVVVAHGGEIRVRTSQTSIRRRQGQAHHVVFVVELPLRQPSKKKARKDQANAEKNLAV